MLRKDITIWFWVALSALLLAGCTRDPQVRKKRDVEKGDAYFQKGKYREAALEYANAIKIDSHYEEAHYKLAQCFLKQSQWNYAYAELSRAVELAPGDSKAQLDIAGLLLAAGKFPDARDHAQTILKSDPRNAAAQVTLSDTDARDNLPKAVEEAQQAVAIDANRAGSYLNLAVLQERNKDLPAAEQNFQKAVSLDPKSIPALVGLGQFYMRQKRGPEAERQFQLAVAAAPKDANLRAILANFYLSQGQKDKAEQILKDARSELKDDPAAYRMLADFYMGQNETGKAADEYASVYKEHPKDLAVGKAYVQVLILQNVDEATKVNDGILKITPKDTEAQVLRGQILNREGKSQDAANLLAAMVRDNPDSAMAHYQLGVAYAGLSNLGQAETEWRAAGRLQPNAVEPQRALANLAARNGNPSLLTDASNELIRIEPNSSEGYLFHARAAYATGNTAGAESDIKKAIEVAPSSSAGYLLLADFRLKQKRLDEAEKLYLQALAISPSDVTVLTGLVGIDLERKDLAKALRAVQDQVAKVPPNSGMYLLLGQLEVRSQDSVKAQAALQKAIDLDKTNVPAFLLLGSLQASQGLVQQSISVYKKALESNPRDVRLYVALGGMLETQNQWQEAQTYYQKALDIDPDYPVAANNLAYLMLAHGENPNVAFTLAQTARKGLPNVPNSADTLGWAYYNQGAYSSAIDLLQEAIKGDPKNPNYHFHLGMAYEKEDNHAMAKKQFEDALQINPNFNEAADARKMLGQSQQN